MLLSNQEIQLGVKGGCRRSHLKTEVILQSQTSRGFGADLRHNRVARRCDKRGVAAE